MKTKIFSTTLTALLLTVAFTTAQAQVPADDFHAIGVEASNISHGAKGIRETQESLTTRIQKLTDLGSLMDKLLSINFLFPQKGAVVSKTAVESVTPSSSKSDGAAGAASSVGGTKNPSFPGTNTVSESIKKGMQIQEEGAEEKCGQNSKAKKAAESMLGAATGGLMGKSGLKSADVQKKRKQASISKQMFSHYALATGLVNRTLAYRTINANRKKTQEKVDSAQEIRKVHSAKTDAVANMAETYNRLLFSQAISNGMSAFKAIDQIEGKITIGVPLPNPDLLEAVGIGF